MPVNANKSGSRLLAVLEQMARSQPIGVRQLARLMETEKSAVQRAIATLAEAGWIQPASIAVSGWELSGRILHIAHLAHGSNSLRLRARPILDSLRDTTGETVFLAISDLNGFIVVEVSESRQALRMVIPVGGNIPANDTAPGQAVLPHLGLDQQVELLGRQPDEQLLVKLEQSRRQGYSVSEDASDENSLNIAAPIFDIHNQAIGTIVICAVQSRASADFQARYGTALVEKARELSYAGRTELHLADLRNAIGRFG